MCRFGAQVDCTSGMVGIGGANSARRTPRNSLGIPPFGHGSAPLTLSPNKPHFKLLDDSIIFISVQILDGLIMISLRVRGCNWPKLALAAYAPMVYARDGSRCACEARGPCFSLGLEICGKQASASPVRGAEMAKKHPGFKAVQEQIARKEGISKERAGAMLAAKTRRASPAAKKANPRLKRVKG